MFWNNKRTYLDFAAGVSANPSSPHEEGRRARSALEDARTNIARLVEVHSNDVIFTSGATEANALAILGVVRSRQKAVGSNKLHVLYLPSAHASVVENMKLLANEGVDVEELPIKNYRVDTETLAKMLRQETVLVSMDAVCGETGVVWNTRTVAEVLRGKVRLSEQLGESDFPTARPLLHIDASQAPFTEKITMAHFNADMLTIDASKVCDARGIGVLIARNTTQLEPLYRGGGQERGLRPGSEVADLAEKFSSALSASVSARDGFRAYAETARKELIEIITEKIPNVYINESNNQAPNILNISLLGRDTDYLAAILNEDGFAVSTRSACETDSEEGSRAVLALTDDLERAKSTLRISWGPHVKSRELYRFSKALILAVSFVDNERER